MLKNKIFCIVLMCPNLNNKAFPCYKERLVNKHFVIENFSNPFRPCPDLALELVCLPLLRQLHIRWLITYLR